ncbi:hypothetical protein Clacol_005848 [Clathrus columnatus]|uniref:Uncharacterized protein n=1 Tax=Clathrus columnatus TaxID=1419009 RepID=A0AAV5ADN9_9AGAM|nr:hypothetical protein Clacol_005848 [Clathrus columnatus]
MVLFLDLLPEAMSSITLCDKLGISAHATSVLSFIGVQGSLPTLLLINNTTTVTLDALAFVAVIHRVWGLWKLGRSLDLEISNDLITTIFRQGLLRLSTLLICESTIDLRRRNAQRSIHNQSAAVQNNPVRTITLIFERMHESIMTEMGERNHPVHIDHPGASEGDNSSDDGMHRSTGLDNIRI